MITLSDVITDAVGIDRTKLPTWRTAAYTDIPIVIKEICEFIETYLIPYLDELTSITGLLKCYENGDPRLFPLSAHIYVYIAAAYLTVGKPDEALAALTKRLGSPGMRKQYQSAFDYVETYAKNDLASRTV